MVIITRYSASGSPDNSVGALSALFCATLGAAGLQAGETALWICA